MNKNQPVLRNLLHWLSLALVVIGLWPCGLMESVTVESFFKMFLCPDIWVASKKDRQVDKGEEERNGQRLRVYYSGTPSSAYTHLPLSHLCPPEPRPVRRVLDQRMTRSSPISPDLLKHIVAARWGTDLCAVKRRRNCLAPSSSVLSGLT